MVCLNRGLTTIGTSLAILLVLALPFSLNSAAQSDRLIGSEWVYDYTEETIGIIFSGKLTYSCERVTSTALGGTDRNVVEYKSVLSATASISPDMSGDVDGHISEIGAEYYDLETDDLIGYIYNSAQTLDAAVVGLGTLSMNSFERGETYFLPPGGTGTEPSTFNPGDTWQKSYMKHSKALGHNGDEYFSEESTFNMTISYEFVGFETVTVPAGDFDCLHIRKVTSDGFEEEGWYSNAVLNYVKIIYTAWQADTITYELDSYVLAQESAEPVAMASNFFIAMFFSFIAATVIAVIYAGMIIRGKKPPETQILQAESLEKGIYRP